MAIILDQGRLYRVNDGVTQHAEQVLTQVAAAYRPRVQMSQVILNAHRRMKRVPFAVVIDIHGFFDHLPWWLLDRVIDQLPADHQVQDLLQKLVRVHVIDRTSGQPVERRQGIPQGLSISPTMANLAMNDFDREVAHALSRLSVVIRRWCDDILLCGPTQDAVRAALAIVQDRLARLGLTLKDSNAEVIDTRVEPINWLGISFGPEGLGVPLDTVEQKAASLQAKINQGLLDSEAVEDSLVATDKHYRRIIGSGRTEQVIRSIREKLVLPQPGKEGHNPIQLAEAHRHCGTNSPEHRPGGDAGRNRWTTPRLGLPIEGDRNPPGKGHAPLSRFVAPTAISSGATDPGAPAGSAPEVVKNQDAVWRIGAVAPAPRRAHVVARNPGDGAREQWVIDIPDAISRPETLLHALAEGVTRLRELGAMAVAVIVTDPTLYGYGWRRWEVHSLRMHTAIAALDRATLGLEVTFEPGRKFR